MNSYFIIFYAQIELQGITENVACAGKKYE